ncbi:hypothetical protein BVRB_3g048460 [Beta vulgaris subsp. vulgaris]|nr:hypothetical protein BVRB_3g048460 [Beta vulgaris subsp. vulgaris]
MYLPLCCTGEVLEFSSEGLHTAKCNFVAECLKPGIIFYRERIF